MSKLLISSHTERGPQQASHISTWNTLQVMCGYTSSRFAEDLRGLLFVAAWKNKFLSFQSIQHLIYNENCVRAVNMARSYQVSKFQRNHRMFLINLI